MTLLTIFAWGGILIAVIVIITALAYHGSTGLDKITDVIATFLAIMLGAVLAMAFIPPETQAPIRDVIWNGKGFNAAPDNPVYTPNPVAQSEIDLPPVGATDSWRIQATLKPGEDGKVHLPQDTKVQAMKAWTVNQKGKESLAVTIK